MEIDTQTPSFVASLPELRQFSFILTGDEEVADVAVAKALKMALASFATASRFPCHRSWLLAHLLEVVRQTTSRSSTLTHAGVSGLITLLQIPSEERAVLVLTEGLRFDLATTSIITGHSREEVLRLVATARMKFQYLAPDYGSSWERDLRPLPTGC